MIKGLFIIHTVNFSPMQGKIWRFAHKRASFKRHLAAYLVINALLWAIFSLNTTFKYEMIWFSLGWFMGLFFHFWGTYFGAGDYFHKKEYQYLSREETENEFDPV